MGIADVRLNITYPDATVKNFSIFSNKTGSATFYCIKPYYQVGTYSFHVYARDTSGNIKKSATHQFEIEDQSPPTLSSITINPLTQNVGGYVNLSAVIMDNVGVDHVYLVITYPDESSKNISITGNLTSGHAYYSRRAYSMLGTYEFYFYTVDTSGNANASAVRTFETQDLTPPSVQVITPEEGDYVGGIYTIKWNATDAVGGLKVTLKYSPNNGQTWHLIASNLENTGEHEWNTTDLEDGDEYLIEVSAKDTSNNVGKAISEQFYLDNTPPTLIVEKPEAGKLYLFDREVLPILGQRAYIFGRITIVADPDDALTGISKVEFFIDNAYKAQDTSSPYQWTWDENTVGAHTIKVVAYDGAGNKISKEIDVFTFNPL